MSDKLQEIKKQFEHWSRDAYSHNIFEYVSAKDIDWLIAELEHSHKKLHRMTGDLVNKIKMIEKLCDVCISDHMNLRKTCGVEG